MIRNPYYRLEYIAGLPYLLAYGQATADFKHDVRLNETSVFLWEHLEQVSSATELASLCAEHFHCPPDQYDVLEATTISFINSLRQMNILLPEEGTTKNIPLYKILEIAGLFIKLHGPEEAFAKELLSFETSKEFPDNAPIQNIYIKVASPAHTENGTLLLRNKELVIIQTPNKYILFLPSSQYISEIHLQSDGRIVSLYCTPIFSEEAVNEISYAIRIAFLFFAQQHHMLAIHSASILYQDRAWLFSAPSGTGKSTHAAFWKTLYDTPILNGDLNLIGLQDGIPVVYGIPWCGTSGIYDVHTYPLGGIAFLNQGSKNRLGHPSPERKQLLMLHRSVSPAWDSTMQQHNLEVIRELSESLFLCHLFCTNSEEAAKCLKKEIDTYLNC